MNELSIVKKYLSNINCGNCGDHCDHENFSVLGHKEDIWLFSVYCSSCKSRGMVVVDIKRGIEPQVINDQVEIEKSELAEPVSLLDIFDLHIFLDDFDGDFASLFAEG